MLYVPSKTFFFKQKTAYEIMPSLVGSEMCIRDRCRDALPHAYRDFWHMWHPDYAG